MGGENMLRSMSDVDDYIKKILSENEKLKDENERLRYSVKYYEDHKGSSSDIEEFISNLKKMDEELKTINKIILELKEENNQLKIENEELKTENEELDKKYSVFCKKTRQISDEQIEEIKKLRENGYTYSQIRKKTNWSNVTISRVLNGYYDMKRVE